MACPNNQWPGTPVHSAHSAGVLSHSLSPFNAAEPCKRRLTDKAVTPTGSVNRGQVLKSNPPILTSIKREGGDGGESTEPSKDLGRIPLYGSSLKQCNHSLLGFWKTIKGVLFFAYQLRSSQHVTETLCCNCGYKSEKHGLYLYQCQ